jgi:hypothetical protein
VVVIVSHASFREEGQPTAWDDELALDVNELLAALLAPLTLSRRARLVP